ncbi:MAG TPA: serine/threonine-protein kinase [Solirubrobacteraceae bacterium]
MSSSEVRTGRMTRTPTQSTRSTPRPPADQPPVPVVLERYRLQRRLGSGAFGTVWLARDERLDRDVAVKILARERIVDGRFEREARAAARLSHPAIVTLYEAAVDDEGAYLVSELVRGATLDELHRDGRLSDRDVVSIGIALCDALEHAHAQGVVHRDVKPSNVLVPDVSARSRARARVAKLTDFGVARVIGGDSLTMTGDVLGTLAYMAPEQAEGLEAGTPADLYSLALVVYEALSGVNPNLGTTSRVRRLGIYLPPLRRQRRDLPRELGQGIDLALRPRPRERGSIEELRTALAAAQGHVSDEPGVVAGPWTTILTAPMPGSQAGAYDDAADSRRGPFRWSPLRDRDRDRDADGDRMAAPPASATAGDPAAHDPAARGLAGGGDPYPWPPRALGAIATAALTVWLMATAFSGWAGSVSASPVSPAAAGLLAGVATLLLPRLGWGAVGAALCVVAASQHHPGLALVLAIAFLVPLLLLPAHAPSWPLAAGAPALGLIGLAGAWPAVAARAATSWRRAVLGAVGWLWLLLCAPIVGRGLYLPMIGSSPRASPEAWTASLSQTAHHVLIPLVTTGVLAPALVWAAAAVVLPWLVSGRSPALDLIRVVVWAAMLASGTGVAITAAHGSNSAGSAPGAAIGAVLAAAVALMPVGVTVWRRALLTRPS